MDRRRVKCTSPNELTPFEVIAKRVGAGGHLLEHPPDDRLLFVLAADVLVKFDEARLAAVVHDDDAFNHIAGAAGYDGGDKRRWREVGVPGMGAPAGRGTPTALIHSL